MEQNTPKFRIHLNLFDGIVILLALLVGGFLLWTQLAPQEEDTAAVTATTQIEYTIRLNEVLPGTGDAIPLNSSLEDAIKNYDLGTVVSVTTSQALRTAQNVEDQLVADVPLPDMERVEIVVSATAVQSDSEVTLTSGYTLLVGEWVYVRGPGYVGGGPVTAISREVA